MKSLLQDVRYGLRMLRKSPGFTAVAIITLALGIGANTAIFTLVEAVMLKSLPVKNPGELYRLGDNYQCCLLGGGLLGDWSLFPYQFYQQIRDRTPEFTDVAAFRAALSRLSVRRSGTTFPAEVFAGELVSGNYFRTLGIGAYAGRLISPVDDQAGATPVVVMSYRAWQRRFALDPSVIGSTFIINQKPFTLTGVAPPGFFGETLRTDPPDFWLPLSAEPSLEGVNSALNDPGLDWLYAIGRLKPGASSTHVQSEVTQELRQWLSVQPGLSAENRAKLASQHITLMKAGDGVVRMRHSYEDDLKLLVTIVGLVLLIACANIANLLMARGSATRSAIAVRVALGATRGRLIRQSLTESILLSIIGGLAGLLVAFAGTKIILLLAFRGAQFVPIDPRPSLPVLGFAFLLSLVTGVAFGLAPAWITSHSDPAEALRGAGRVAKERSIPQKSLVVLQISLSCILLIAAGLLTQSLHNLEGQRFGFETQGRLIVRVDPVLAGYTTEKLQALYEQLEQRLPQIPSVQSASYSSYIPMGGSLWSEDIHIEGHTPDEHTNVFFDRVGPRYFETMGTRILRGRPIDEGDTPSGRQVAVINESFARQYFPNQDPIGKHFGFSDSSHASDIEIVGLVADAKYADARSEASSQAFLPFLHMVTNPKLSFLNGTHFIGNIELRVVGKPENLEDMVRRTLAEIDPNLTVLSVVSMREQVDLNFNQETLIARLTELFGMLALILACVGLYGVTAYSVARRTSEIGIRMALGADRQNVLKLVLRGALVQLAIGLAIGIPAALAGSRLIASQLYRVKTYDPVILGGAVLVLTACALLAGFIPSRRAASVEPMEALRTE